MTTIYKSLNRNSMPEGDRAGDVILHRIPIPVAVRGVGDTDVVGYLPANHRLIPELCSVSADASVTVTGIDVYVDTIATKLIATLVIAGGAYQTQPVIGIGANEAGSIANITAAHLLTDVTIGISSANRDIGIKWNATSTAAGNLILNLAYAPQIS